MSYQTFRFKSDLQTQVSTKPNVQVIKLGGGFEQRVPIGLNNKLKVYSLTFTLVENDYKEAIQFLDDHGGYLAFNWVDPRKVTRLVVCREWSETQMEFGVYQIQCEFQEVIE